VAGEREPPEPGHQNHPVEHEALKGVLHFEQGRDAVDGQLAVVEPDGKDGRLLDQRRQIQILPGGHQQQVEGIRLRQALLARETDDLEGVGRSGRGPERVRVVRGGDHGATPKR